MEIRKERTIVLTKELRNMEVGRKREREKKREIVRSILETLKCEFLNSVI